MGREWYCEDCQAFVAIEWATSDSLPTCWNCGGEAVDLREADEFTAAPMPSLRERWAIEAEYTTRARAEALRDLADATKGARDDGNEHG